MQYRIDKGIVHPIIQRAAIFLCNLRKASDAVWDGQFPCQSHHTPRRDIIAQSPFSNNIAQLPDLDQDGLWIPV